MDESWDYSTGLLVHISRFDKGRFKFDCPHHETHTHENERRADRKLSSFPKMKTGATINCPVRSEESIMAYFLYKLIAPPVTFTQDIASGEPDLMRVHDEYWSDLTDRGIVVVFGPVLDPKGSWGLAIVEAKDEAEVRALGMNDPAIKSHFGFHFEVYPMPQAVLRK